MNIYQSLMSQYLVNENQLTLRPFRVSNVDERHYFATFAFCVAPGHIADNVIFLIYDEYLSIVGVPIVRKWKSTNFEPI